MLAIQTPMFQYTEKRTKQKAAHTPPVPEPESFHHPIGSMIMDSFIRLPTTQEDSASTSEYTPNRTKRGYVHEDALQEPVQRVYVQHQV